ncbi:probable protein phosphatase 2C 75 [Telopea speciosissima]|uniref:probable protein phosphatase 2C 75 n=1 Tax=Telopea speciosissima TaxID=54955 RepID=UPI001CC49641|nr:probable protein phosphatase 2C 75 [Telopea speciosissima]
MRTGVKYLTLIVISEPELTITESTSEDECLILVSDGLWDVFSNDLACEVARKCLHEEGSSSTVARILNVETLDEDTGTKQVNQSRCPLVVALLTCLALGQKSSNNISVIVIDLKIGSDERNWRDSLPSSNFEEEKQKDVKVL